MASLPPSMTSAGRQIVDLSFEGWFESIPSSVYRSDLTELGSSPCSVRRTVMIYCELLLRLQAHLAHEVEVVYVGKVDADQMGPLGVRSRSRIAQHTSSPEDGATFAVVTPASLSGPYAIERATWPQMRSTSSCFGKSILPSERK